MINRINELKVILALYKYKVYLYVLPYGQMSLWGLNLKPQMYDFYLILPILVLISPVNLTTELKTVRLKGIYRIGPHNKDILSILFGSLLGDAHAEKRLKGLGTRFYFFQEDSHVEYIYFCIDFYLILAIVILKHQLYQKD
jgi:hypothetical protein